MCESNDSSVLVMRDTVYSEILEVLVRLALVWATSFLFGIVLMTYLRLRSRKMLLISIGFGIFFVHALLYIPGLIAEHYHVILTENVHLMIHLVALIFIALGIFKD